MSQTDKYIRAATRENTRKSYASAIKHYEESWGGFLPGTADSVASYLAHYASSLSLSTLKQRIAAISAWHTQQGFPDPTKAPHVKKVLKGIANIHPYQPKKATPLQLDYIHKIDSGIVQALSKRHQIDAKTLKLLRDRALILLGFWRAFRSDELTRLRIEHVKVINDQGMEMYLSRSKTDTFSKGATHRIPMLKALCPVSAYRDWIDASRLTEGPVFPAIDQWAHIASTGLTCAAVINIVKHYSKLADIESSPTFTSHSLRRGLATWANSSGWSLEDLMQHVGWKDIRSAMSYVDNSDPFSKNRIENAIDAPQSEITILPKVMSITLELKVAIERYSKHTRGVSATRNTIEEKFLKDLKLKKFENDQSRYEITVSYKSGEHLEEVMDDLLHQMHQVAQQKNCMLEAIFIDPVTGRTWE